MLAHNLKLSMTPCELGVFRNTDWCVLLMNSRPFCWSSCLVAGIEVSNPDEDMDVGPLCLLCVT